MAQFIVTPFNPGSCDIIEHTNDEQDAIDQALDISVELNGDPVIVFKDGKEWKMITA